MKAKSSIISLILIICLVISTVIGYKKGYIGDIFNLKTKKIVDNVTNNNESITRTSEIIYENESSVLDIGDEYEIEDEGKDYRGNVDNKNSYKIKEKYIDSYITRTLPEGMFVTFYSGNENDYLSDDNRTFSEKYSYVIVTLELVNESNEESMTTFITPTVMQIGYFNDDNVFTMYDYGRGGLSGAESIKGHVELPIGSKNTVNLCYIIPDELLDRQLVVAGMISEYDKGAPKVPYFKVKMSAE